MDKDFLKHSVKRKISGLLVVILFVAYYFITDPDTKLFQNLGFGVNIILTLNIFVLSMATIIMIEFLPDFFVDVIYGKEFKLREKAVESSEGASNVMIAKSIRILAYSFIASASIIAYNIG